MGTSNSFGANDKVEENSKIQTVSLRFIATDKTILLYIMGDKYHDGFCGAQLAGDLSRILSEKIQKDEIDCSMTFSEASALLNNLRSSSALLLDRILRFKGIKYKLDRGGHSSSRMLAYPRAVR